MTHTQTNATTRTPAIDATMDADSIMYGTLTLTFGNGQTLTINGSDLTSNMQRHAMLHGLKQKLVDAAAISRNPDNGRSATIDDKYNAVREVYDRLLSGQWNKGRADGEPTGGLLFRALCIVYADKTPDAIREFLGKKTKEQQAALRVVPKIAAVIEQLKAKQAKANDVDTDALLDELNDGAGE